MTPIFVPTAQLARLLRLTARRVQQLVTIGIVPKPSKAGHDVCVAVPQYLAYVERPGESRNLSEARKKKVEVETKIKTLELRQRMGELVEVAEVRAAQFAEYRRVRDNFLNLPSRTDAAVAAEVDQAKCFEILRRETNQILEGLTRETDTDPEAHDPSPR